MLSGGGGALRRMRAARLETLPRDNRLDRPAVAYDPCTPSSGSLIPTTMRPQAMWAAWARVAKLSDTPVRSIVLAAGAIPTVILGTAHATTHDGAPVVALDDAVREDLDITAENTIPAADFDPAEQPLLRVGARGEVVARLQKRLDQLGYDPGHLPGVYDASLRRSVVEYQRNHAELEVDGIVGNGCWTRLAGADKPNPNRVGIDYAPRTIPAGHQIRPAASWDADEQPTLRYGARGPVVERLQARLDELGYDVGKKPDGTFDGVYGRKLRAAVVEYQNDQGHLAVEAWVGYHTWHALARSQPVRLPGPTMTPGGTPILSRYEPGSGETRALFREAAAYAGLPESWADSTGLHRLLRSESGGQVGIPNYTYGNSIRNHPDRFREVHAELLLGVKSTRSSATGIGQLLLDNVDRYYPSGRFGIGDPLEEAVGMLRYIKARYGNPDAAWSRYNDFHEGY